VPNTDRILPWLAGGSLGIAGLLELARRKTFTPEWLADLNRFSQQRDLESVMGYRAGMPEAQKAFHGVADYAIQGSKLLQHKLWGVLPVQDLIKGIRSGPWMPDSAKWQPGSEHHYNAFTQGPLPAALRLVQEVGQGWDPTGVGGVKLSDASQQHLADAFNKTVESGTGAKNYFDWKVGSPSRWFTEASNPGILPHADQVKALRQIANNIPQDADLARNVPELSELTKVLGRTDEKVRSNYADMVGPVLNVNSTMRNVALGLAGAGALGLGVAGVRKYFQMRKEHHSAKDKKEETPAFPVWAARRVGSNVGLVKSASVQESLTQVLLNNPKLRNLLGFEAPKLDINLGLGMKGTATGAGVGAGIGTLGMLLNSPGKQESQEEAEARRRRAWLLNPVTGAALGMVPGFLYDYAGMRGAQEMWNQIPAQQQQQLVQMGGKVRAGAQASFNQ